MKHTAIALLALVATLATPAAAQLTPASRSRLSMHVTVPPSPVTTDRSYRLLYELHIENRGDVAVTLSSLDIRTNTSDAGKPALTLDGDRLIRALDAPADRKAPLTIAAGARRVLYVDLGETSRPRALRHVLRATSSAGA